MQPPPPSGAATATSIDYVNVRSGPGTNYTILAVAPPGATGEVTGKSSDGAWWQVKIPTTYSADGLGWVSADWVVTQGTESTPVVAAPPAPPTAPATPPPATSSSCYVSQSPADGTVYAAGTSFTTTWVLQNNTGTSWDQNSVDLRYLQRQRVHQRRQHPHVVGGGPVHAGGAGGDASKDVAAADHDGDLHAQPRHVRDFGDDPVDHLAVDAVRVVTHQRLAGQLEQDSPVGGFCVGDGDGERGGGRRAHGGGLRSVMARTQRWRGRATPWPSPRLRRRNRPSSSRCLRRRRRGRSR